jgi:hypothetical protein
MNFAREVGAVYFPKVRAFLEGISVEYLAGVVG